MQKRKILCAAAVLMTALTLFFTTLPLYASGAAGSMNSNTAGGSDSTIGGVLENAADAVRGAAENIFGSRRDAGNTAGNTSGNTSGNTAGNGQDGNLTDNTPSDNGSLNPDGAQNGMAGDNSTGNNGTAGDSITGNDNTAGGSITGNDNTADGSMGSGGSSQDNGIAGDELLPGETAGDGATLGDVNGDGITDDRAPETSAENTAEKDTGLSWGGILLAILAAVAVVAVVVLLVPRKSKM